MIKSAAKAYHEKNVHSTFIYYLIILFVHSEIKALNALPYSHIFFRQSEVYQKNRMLSFNLEREHKFYLTLSF